MLSDFMSSHSLQFEFKKDSNCASAIFVVQKVVKYFTYRGSTVYLAVLDATKAFDNVNHKVLTGKLADRKVAMCFM
jgi:hypothetical protein